MIIIRHCKNADKEHKESQRQYAHTYHYKGNVICVAKAWILLPLSYQMGLIAHEIGHLLVGFTDHKESEADRLANKFFGVTIRYKDSIYGSHLEYLSNKDVMGVYNWGIKNVVLKGLI